MLKMNRYLILTIFVLFIFLFRDKDTQKKGTYIKNTPVIEKEILLNETPEMSKSPNETWWLNSGGKVFIDGPLMKTIQGDLPEDDYWRNRYYDSNPTETDNGFHPQNIFRLVTKQKYQNVTQSMYFKINRYIMSKDSHRSASNGVLFFHHYQDGDNLYYAGLRVDGYALIKKKTKGIYYTMAYKSVFPGVKYDRNSHPNLLPTDKWIGIKSKIENLNSKEVSIKLYVDRNMSGAWELVAETIDNGRSFGGYSILNSGYAGIRTDFMDAEFNKYKISEM